jgi:hypothetical protein
LRTQSVGTLALSTQEPGPAFVEQVGMGNVEVPVDVFMAKKVFAGHTGCGNQFVGDSDSDSVGITCGIHRSGDK